MTEAELSRLYEFIEGGYRHPTTMGRLRRSVGRGVRSVLGRAGRRREEGGPAPVDRSQAVDPLTAVYRREALDFFVPVAACRNVAQFGFGNGAFDAWQETARQVAYDPDVPASETVLASFAERFQPQTAAELLFSSPQQDVPAGSLLWQISTAEAKYFWPWSPTVPKWPAAATPDLRLPSHGPLGPDVIELEVWRLKRLTASIKANGYRPRPVDAIRGSLLARGDEMLFLIRAGFHRVAALAALGHDEVPVRLADGAQRLMTIDQLPTWPLVREGVFPPELAELLVERLFSEDGSEVASRLGLVPGKDDA